VINQRHRREVHHIEKAYLKDGFSFDLEESLNLFNDSFGLGRGEIDLIHDGDDGEILGKSKVKIGQGLGLDAAAGIDEE
jgi:hypothetical protein